MTADRRPIPDGVVSTIRGHRQVPVLTWLIRVVLVLSAAGGLLGGPVGRGLATAAVVAVVAASPVRVGWLLLRWRQERDQRYFLLGVAVIAVIASGAVLALLGVGG